MLDCFFTISYLAILWVWVTAELIRSALDTEFCIWSQSGSTTGTIFLICRACCCVWNSNGGCLIMRQIRDNVVKNCSGILFVFSPINDLCGQTAFRGNIYTRLSLWYWRQHQCDFFAPRRESYSVVEAIPNAGLIRNFRLKLQLEYLAKYRIFQQRLQRCKWCV